MKKLLITNVAYGERYANVFLRQHLKSLLDQTNIYKFQDRIEYLIFTDEETRPQIEADEFFKELRTTIQVDIKELEWSPNLTDQIKFNGRYSVLVQTLQASIAEALKRRTYLSPIVADLVVAKKFFNKIFARLDEGYDAVFMHPLRAAYEVVAPRLNNFENACTDLQLFELGYQNMHPLWVACHWEAAQFTNIPDTLLWNSGTGLLARSFSITPIAFLPNESMRGVTKVIDVSIPPLCINPYWCEDWIDAPVIGCEFLSCFYPPFRNHTASVEFVKSRVGKERRANGLKKIYYPSKGTVDMHFRVEDFSDYILDEINRGL